uniref:Uncharacterized protein n=1 Tax=Brassica oleracea TaxID=3712 RepID=A0A3P6DDX4_BRAOL|nr:unnamed protein product [Brassica oleracea]
MTSLVVLNLSSNRELAELPDEVSNLVSLQFLNLSFTSLKRLPLGLKELTRLIHLDLEHTHQLRGISMIASLLNLQVLQLFWSVPLDIDLIEDIELLKGLKNVSLTVKEDDMLEWLSRSCIYCIRLSVSKCTIWNGGIELLTSLSSLRELDITSCRVWETRFEHLKDFPKFKSILKLSLDGCYSLRDLTSLLCTPFLQDLSLIKCDIRQLISKEKAKAQLGRMSEQPLQYLTRLSLYDLPNLESIHWTLLRFPVLEYLRIGLCPQLKRLPFDSETAKGNQLQLDIDEQCMHGVRWEDEATKQRFSHMNNRSGIQFVDQPMVRARRKLNDGDIIDVRLDDWILILDLAK